MDLVEELQKKDEDLKIVHESIFGVTVETQCDIHPIESTVVEQRFYGVTLRIIRHLFLVNTALWFFIGIFGIVPAHLLLKKGSFVVIISLFSISLGLGVIINILLFFARKHHEFIIVLFGCFILCLTTVFFSLTALLQSIGPLQGCMIMFTESVLILLYCIHSTNRRKLDPHISFLIMMCGGVCVWGIGFIAFIKEQDWFTSAFLFFICVLGFPFYSAYQIQHASRYHVRELSQAIVGFFTDYFSWIRYVKRAEVDQRGDPSSVHVEKQSFVERDPVLNEANI